MEGYTFASLFDLLKCIGSTLKGQSSSSEILHYKTYIYINSLKVQISITTFSEKWTEDSWVYNKKNLFIFTKSNLQIQHHHEGEFFHVSQSFHLCEFHHYHSPQHSKGNWQLTKSNDYIFSFCWLTHLCNKEEPNNSNLHIKKHKTTLFIIVDFFAITFTIRA